MKLLTLILMTISLAGADTARDALARQDLDTLATELPRRHPNLFFQTPRAVFDQAVAGLRAAIPTLTDNEILVGLARIAALPGDAHTNIFLTQRNSVSRLLPLTLRWFDDGLFVTGTGASYRRAAGAKVVAIGGVPVEDAYARIAELISHENDSWAREISVDYMVNNDILAALRLSSDSLTANFTLQTLAGETFDLAVASAPPGAPSQVTPYPDPGAGYTPLGQRQRSLNYWFTYLESTRTLYFAYNSCAEMASDPFAAFNARLWATFDSKPVERVVIDLRNNVGGNSAVLDPFLISGNERAEAFLARGRAYVLIGRRTFSSGTLNALQLHQGPVLLVGEPSGGDPVAYGEVLSFPLPNSHLVVSYSTRMMQGPGIAPFTPVMPDITVRTTSADYFARHDPVLAAVLADAVPPAPAAPGAVTVVNAASYKPGPVAPGSIASAFGSWSAAKEVFVNDKPARVVASAAGQVNFVVPDGAAAGSAAIRVVDNGQTVGAAVFEIAGAAPGLFVLDAAAPQRPAAAIVDGRIVQLYGTGQGPGAPATRVYVGSELARVLYSGPQPSIPGLWQVNVELPDGVSGEAPVFAAVGAAVSNGVTVQFGK